MVLSLLTWLLLTLLSRVSPLDSPLSLRDSAWYLASCWARGSSYRPAAHSTRLLSCCWWIFSLTIIVIFFTQLPGLLARDPVTRSRHQSLSSVLDNVNNIGLVRGGSTHQLLQVSFLQDQQTVSLSIPGHSSTNSIVTFIICRNQRILFIRKYGTRYPPSRTPPWWRTTVRVMSPILNEDD